MTASPPTRLMQLALGFTALLWTLGAAILAGKSAHGLVTRFNAPSLEPLLVACFLLFLVVIGLRAIDSVSTSSAHLASIFPLPRRPGFAREWGLGAAVGWAACLAAVLPLLFSRNLHARLAFAPGSLGYTLIALLTLLVLSLAEEVIFRGYALARLTAAIGPTAASIVSSILFSLVLLWSDPPLHWGLGLLDGILFGLLLSMAFLRTHSLWLPWGLHFAYRAVAAIAFGLPIAGHTEFSTVVDTDTTGPTWLSGGHFGLDAGLFTLFVLIAAMFALYRLTSDYAWLYTHRPIVAAGYEVTVAPPAAHAAMEAAAAPPPLVQILPSTPQTRSVEPPPVPR